MESRTEEDVHMMNEEITRKELLAQKLKQEGKDSAHNSDEEEDEHMREAREKKEEKEGAPLINYSYLGSEECPIDVTADEIEYSMIFRIPRIEGLEECKLLRVTKLHY